MRPRERQAGLRSETGSYEPRRWSIGRDNGSRVSFGAGTRPEVIWPSSLLPKGTMCYHARMRQSVSELSKLQNKLRWVCAMSPVSSGAFVFEVQCAKKRAFLSRYSLGICKITKKVWPGKKL